MTNQSQTISAREQRARRKAKALGYYLRKVAVFTGYPKRGRYYVLDGPPATHDTPTDALPKLLTPEHGLNLEEIEKWLGL